VRELRRRAVAKPILLMGSLNPFQRYGLEKLAMDARDVGVNGFMIPDMPTEESRAWDEIAEDAGLENACYVAANTTNRRLAASVSRHSGFIYCLASNGLAGTPVDPGAELQSFLSCVRRATSLPVAVGYGIATADHVRRVSPWTDGVIVGTALVQAVLDAPAADRVRRLSEMVTRLTKATARPSVHA
jgi:tryptophan synthase alpha chain